MKDNKVIHAKLVKANRDIMGDLESVVIKDELDQKRVLTIKQVELLLKNGSVEIKGLKLTNKGNVKETRRPKIKKKENPKRKKIESIMKEIDRLANSKDNKEKERYYKLKAQLEELLRQDDNLEAYEAIEKKIFKKC